MPDRVSSRIAAAFVAVGLVAVLAVGAGLFVSLRSLHQEATISSLGDIAQPITARIRALGASELRTAVTTLKADLRPELGLYAIVGDRVVSAEGNPAPLAVRAIPLRADLAAGASVGGSWIADDGTRYLYSATVIRREGTLVGRIALVLTAPDGSGALAVRDLLRVLPAVVIVIIIIDPDRLAPLEVHHPAVAPPGRCNVGGASRRRDGRTGPSGRSARGPRVDRTIQ